MRFRDLPRFPCYPDKRPACPHGWMNASADPARIGELWAGRVGLLIGVPTGPPSGLAVLDIDTEGMDWLAAQQLPPTRVHTTRSGGRHLVFRHREGLRCSQGVIAPGVDVRAEGGYVVWWPAHGYAVENDEVLAEWPSIARSNKQEAPSRQETSEGGVTGGGGASCLTATGPTKNLMVRSARILSKVETAPVGTRNKCLFWAACRFAEMIAEGVVTRRVAEAVLEAAASVNGLTRDDGLGAVRATIASGLKRA